MLARMHKRRNPRRTQMSDQTVYGESRMAKEKSERLNRRELIALRGLRLPKVTLQVLNESGIFCVPSISVENQRSADQYVIRAQESGGAVQPLFFDRGGETFRVPMSLEAGLRLVVAGVSCCGCRHVHVLAPPAAEAAQIA